MALMPSSEAIPLFADWSASGVLKIFSASSRTYTATEDCVITGSIRYYATQGQNFTRLLVDGTEVASAYGSVAVGGNSYQVNMFVPVYIMVKKGSVIEYLNDNTGFAVIVRKLAY